MLDELEHLFNLVTKLEARKKQLLITEPDPTIRLIKENVINQCLLDTYDTIKEAKI